MTSERTALIGGLESELKRKFHMRRLVMSAFLCTIPLLDAIIVLSIMQPELCRVGSVFLRFIILSYAGISFATAVTGYFGILSESSSALRSSLALIVMDNGLLLFITALLLVDVVTRYNLFIRHRSPKFLELLESNRNFGIAFCVTACLVRILLFTSVSSISELEVYFDKKKYIIPANGKNKPDKEAGENLQIEFNNDYESEGLVYP